MTDECRKAFERDYKANNYMAEDFNYNKKGNYYGIEQIDNAWVIWQNSWKACTRAPSSVESKAKGVLFGQNSILEHFAQFIIDKTGAKVSELELHRQDKVDGYRWWFELKEQPSAPSGDAIGAVIDAIDKVVNNPELAVSRDFMNHWYAFSGDIAKAAIAAMNPAQQINKELLECLEAVINEKPFAIRMAKAAIAKAEAQLCRPKNNFNELISTAISLAKTHKTDVEFVQVNEMTGVKIKL